MMISYPVNDDQYPEGIEVVLVEKYTANRVSSQSIHGEFTVRTQDLLNRWHGINARVNPIIVVLNIRK